jgi:hypothetical protein
MYQDDSFKSINEKVYKLLVNQNDDNREIAETTDMSEEVDKILNNLIELDGFLLDYTNRLVGEDVNVQATGLTTPFSNAIGKMVTVMKQLENQMLSLDINNVSKSSIESLTEYRDKYTEILNSIQITTDDIKDQYGRNDQVPLEYDQVISTLSSLINNINVKLLNYNQTVGDPVSGSGSSYSFSLFNTSDYQPTQFLRV